MFFDFVFDLKKIFFGPEKKSGDSFDAENCVLSIPAVFMAIPALLAELSRINISLPNSVTFCCLRMQIPAKPEHAR